MTPELQALAGQLAKLGHELVNLPAALDAVASVEAKSSAAELRLAKLRSDEATLTKRTADLRAELDGQRVAHAAELARSSAEVSERAALLVQTATAEAKHLRDRAAADVADAKATCQAVLDHAGAVQADLLGVQAELDAVTAALAEARAVIAKAEAISAAMKG